MVPTSDLVVFNSLAWPRNAVVKVADDGAVQDIKSKKILLTQPLPEGGACFIADDLPAVGYRSYRDIRVKMTPPPDAVQISDNQMENEFYRVTLNPKTGGIQSIYDKQLGRELVDSNSDYDLGELIYVTGGKGTYAIHSDLANLPPPHFEYHPQTGAKIESVNGPVFGEMDSESTAENFPNIKMRVRLYRGLKQLDLIYELDKTETLDNEAVYLAFPFAPDPSKGGLWLDYPDALTEPLKDQHSSACRDWYSVQRWLAVSDGDDTVELSSLDAPLFTIGEMTASTWPREIPIHRGHVFAYIMNNYWHTNYKASQGGHFVFHYSLTSSAGGFSKQDAVVSGWNMYCPAVATSGEGEHKPVFLAATDSLVGIKPLGLALTTIKGAEDGDGFVFRCCDYTGDGGKLKLTLPKSASAATKCNLVETDEGKLKGHGKIVTAPLEPYAPLSLRVNFNSP
jgi:alpha-mannosidase